MSRHLASIYYQPSWLGGDTMRPFCQRGRPWVGDALLTDREWDVTCPFCIAKIRGVPAPLPTARRDPLRPSNTITLRARTLLAMAEDVADRWQVPMKDLRGEARDAYNAHARQEAMWMMRQAGFTIAQIARFFQRNHATVIFGVKRHAERLAALQVAA